MNTKNLAIVTGLMIIGGSLYLSSAAFAEGTNQDNLITRIAEKFNLNKDDVTKVAIDFRTEKLKTMADKRKTMLEDKLTQAVKDGKITDAQKSAILKKMAELQQKREAERTDMLNWAKQNGLDKTGFGMGMGFGKFGMGRGMHFGR